MKKTILALMILVGGGLLALNGQSGEETLPPVGVNIAPLRTELVSHDLREEAGRDDIRTRSPYYRELDVQAGGASARVVARDSLPYAVLDREVFIHIEGYPSVRLFVNGREAGYGEDSRTPMEFNISGFVKEGWNDFEFDLTGLTGAQLETAVKDAPRRLAYIYSQPKLRVEDYSLVSRADTSGDFYWIDLDIALANSYNSDELITVGYDIYTPQGKLNHYDVQDMVIPARGKDTLYVSQQIYGSGANTWSAEQPFMYTGMIYIRRASRVTEYIPISVGMGTTELKDGVIWRNGQPLEINAARYNSATTSKATEEELRGLKARGINTICPGYPQPYWFYDLCEDIGLYVIDRANINSDYETGNRRMGGTLSNDPRWLDRFLLRAGSAYERNKNRTCIIAWSLGGDSGNGFNMYRTYLMLKGKGDPRPVVYDGAAGEWNSDMAPVSAADAAEVLARPLPAQNTRRR